MMQQSTEIVVGETELASQFRPVSGLLDLSRQQRNLLLLKPVFQLERSKGAM